MKSVVVDASIAIKWVLQEPDSDVAHALLAKWIEEETVILAPVLLAYEITNGLYRKTLKGELTFDKAKLGIRKILLTGLELDFTEDPSFGIKAMELASQFNLAATYDSHYLALAEREGCELWTSDTKMGRAVRGKLNQVRYLEDFQNAEDTPEEQPKNGI
jgi:predicted nucleic acid-binding protein